MRNPRSQLDFAPTELPAHCVASDKDLAPTERFFADTTRNEKPESLRRVGANILSRRHAKGTAKSLNKMALIDEPDFGRN